MSSGTKIYALGGCIVCQLSYLISMSFVGQLIAFVYVKIFPFTLKGKNLSIGNMKLTNQATVLQYWLEFTNKV